MKRKMTGRETLLVASMLFGMFFGAGNLIFPVYMGQVAGENVWRASAGFLLTGVGIPLLGVAALGISRENGLLGLAGRAGKGFGLFFTCALYLTIGPFFAIPRCATVSYTVGIEGILSGGKDSLALAVFSFAFFIIVLLFSLRPGEIMIWIGKVLNPLFLILLGILLCRALTSPAGAVHEAAPAPAYDTGAFFTGVLEGYNTMDALAGLAFGIVVIDVIRRLGIEKPEDVAKSTVRAGIFSAILMAVIYVLVAVMGAQSRGAVPVSSNGGEALFEIAKYYFGGAGALLLAVTVTTACIKTAVGLITSCAETFVELFPTLLSYRSWAVLFSAVSFLIANLGLNTIIEYSLPVLMFLYPLAIVLVLLTFMIKYTENTRIILQSALGFTAVAALLDGMRALPVAAREFFCLDQLLMPAEKFLPFLKMGFGWVLPAAVGTVVGVLAAKWKNRYRTIK